jgi:hypothetical protein
VARAPPGATIVRVAARRVLRPIYRAGRTRRVWTMYA